MKRTDILAEARSICDTVIAHRRALHEQPETGFALDKTLAYVRDRLEELGYSPKRCGRAGITATVGSGRPVFLLRADMDALPIREEADIPFAARNGNMHACGHDMHTAMVLGAAQLLKEHEAELKGTVKLMFQGAEELLEGAKDMLENGLLEDPKPDAGMMIHVMTGSDLPTGTVTVCDGGVSAPGAAYFTVRVQGKGCHGAMPNMGIDPITASAHILLGLQGIRARELGFSEDAVLTVGSFHAGSRPNIIPDTAVLQGSLRAFGGDTVAFLQKRTEEIAVSTATAHRATAEVTWDAVCPPLTNDPALSEQTARWTGELLGKDRTLTQGQLAGQVRSSGSEDFAYVSQQIPTIMVSLAAGSREEGHSYPLHHPKVTFSEEALAVGTAVLTNTAIRWLEAR